MAWVPGRQPPLLMLWTAPPPARECHGSGVLLRPPRLGGDSTKEAIAIIGLDLVEGKPNSSPTASIRRF